MNCIINVARIRSSYWIGIRLSCAERDRIRGTLGTASPHQGSIIPCIKHPTLCVLVIDCLETNHLWKLLY